MTVFLRPADVDSHRGWIPGVHRGMDFGWGNGRNIYCAADGYVESITQGGSSFWGNGWGNRVVIRHNARVATTYNHIAAGTINVSEGQSVTAGQVIALMGDTGDSDGIHLHFEMYLDGERTNPGPYFHEDIPGSDGSGSGGVPAPSGWVVGTTDFTGDMGVHELHGAKWYVVESVTDNTKTIAYVTAQHGITLENAKYLTDILANSQWASHVLQPGSSWWNGTDDYYAGVIVALNDVAGILTAHDAMIRQQQAMDVAESIIPVPAADDPTESNKGFLSRAMVESLAMEEVMTNPHKEQVASMEIKEIVRVKEMPETTNVSNFISSAASNIVLPAVVRKYVLWPVVLLWGIAVVAYGQWYQGIGELPPVEYGGIVNVTLVVLPVIAAIASANTTFSKPKDPEKEEAKRTLKLAKIEAKTQEALNKSK